MTVATNFPNLIDAIVTRLQAASSLSGVRVFDGIEIDESYPGDAIAIGHDGGFGDNDMTIGTLTDSLLDFGEVHEESGVIDCVLWSADGSTDIKARRTRAFAILNAIDTAIRTDPSFSGNCFHSYLQTATVGYRQTIQGVAVTINFTITYQSQS